MSQPSSSSQTPLAATLLRISREAQKLGERQNPYWYAQLVEEDNLFEWHFTVRGPPNTEFEGGCYHGKMILPHNYPSSSPQLYMLTQNGRFEIGKRVCMAITSSQPELWKPDWTFQMMLDALHVIFGMPADGSLNSLDWSVEVRRRLALDSKNWKCPKCNRTNGDIIAEECSSPLVDGPELPAGMVPPKLAAKFQYLRAATSSSNAHEDLPPVSSPSSPPAPECVNEEDTEARRRERRRRPQRTSATFRAFLHLLLVSLLKQIGQCLAYLKGLSRIDAAILFLDVGSVIFLIGIFGTIVNLVQCPGPLVNSFFLRNSG